MDCTIVLSPELWNKYVARAERFEQMGWRTRTSTLPIQDLRQIAYLLPMWGGIWSGVVFFEGDWYFHRITVWECVWYRDLNSSHFFLRFGALEHEANRTPDISATFIGSHKKFDKGNRMSVYSARKRKPSILSVSYRLNRFNRSRRWKTIPFQILCQNTVRTWFIKKFYVVENLTFHYDNKCSKNNCFTPNTDY